MKPDATSKRDDGPEIRNIAKLLVLLACPACQGDVALENKKIICKRCHRAYPIVDGVPVLLVDTK